MAIQTRITAAIRCLIEAECRKIGCAAIEAAWNMERTMLTRTSGNIFVSLAALLVATGISSIIAKTVHGQANQQLPPSLNLDNMPVVATVEAHAGRPYGIGKVTFRLRPGDEIISKTEATWFTEKNDRIH